jgi:uncharacterized surface protein with fasciclin (FAS1) repeats
MPSILNVLNSRTEFPVVFIDMSTLVRAIGLEYILEGTRPITIFAPVDYAFDVFGSEMVFDLLKDLTKLTRLLQYHIVPLKLSVADLKNFASTSTGQEQTDRSQELQIPTFLNQALTVNLADEFIVNGMKVIQSDIMADNGVIHATENILWPARLRREDFGERSPLTQPPGNR